MKKIAFLLVILAVAGCSNKKIPDPAIALCPEKTILEMQRNQAFFGGVVVGETESNGLKKLKGLQRKATLGKDGERPMDLLFYQTSLPRCPWMPWGEALTPVVVKEGVITAVGTEQVKALTAKGWKIEEAKWPWQRYDFGYLPQD